MELTFELDWFTSQVWWYLNEFPYSQTVKFDFGHKIDAIDLQWPPVASLQPPFWPQKYAHDNWGTKHQPTHNELNLTFKIHSTRTKRPQMASKQPQKQPQIYVRGQCWWVLNNMVTIGLKMYKFCIKWHLMASNGLKRPQAASKRAPTASRLFLRLLWFSILGLHTKYEPFRPTGTPSN